MYIRTSFICSTLRVPSIRLSILISPIFNTVQPEFPFAGAVVLLIFKSSLPLGAGRFNALISLSTQAPAPTHDSLRITMAKASNWWHGSGMMRACDRKVLIGYARMRHLSST